MAKARFFTAALLSALVMTPAVQAEESTRAFTNTHSVPLPAIALVDDSSALNLNPGAAGARDVFDLYLSKSIDPNANGHFTATLGLPNLSLGYQQFQAGILGDPQTISLYPTGWGEVCNTPFPSFKTSASTAYRKERDRVDRRSDNPYESDQNSNGKGLCFVDRFRS